MMAKLSHEIFDNLFFPLSEQRQLTMSSLSHCVTTFLFFLFEETQTRRKRSCLLLSLLLMAACLLLFIKCMYAYGIGHKLRRRHTRAGLVTRQQQPKCEKQPTSTGLFLVLAAVVTKAGRHYYMAFV